MSTRKRKSKVKLIGVFIIIVGALVVVAAGVTLGMASTELKAEHLTVMGVAPVGPARSFARPDADVFNAYAPAGMNLATSTEMMALPAQPDSMMNGSFLRALFFIAAIALGVAAPVMGVGVMFAIVGIGPLKGSPKGSPKG
jgi:hypothetical protein